jgi:hypothetical protein
MMEITVLCNDLDLEYYSKVIRTELVQTDFKFLIVTILTYTIHLTHLIYVYLTS